MTPLMTPKETLAAARRLIENPQCWTQGAWGRDEEGNLVSYTSERAVCWCSEGALKVVSGGRWELYSGARIALERALPAQGEATNVTGFNDTHNHTEVLALFDKAIEIACLDFHGKKAAAR